MTKFTKFTLINLVGFLFLFIFTGCMEGEDTGFIDGEPKATLQEFPEAKSLDVDCQEGFISTENGCMEIVCGAGEIYEESCAGDDPFSTAMISATCNENGTDLAVGECALSCLNGYVPINDRCTEVICTADQNSISCNNTGVENSFGFMTLACSNNGTELIPGACMFSDCNDNFVDVEGICLPKICEAGSSASVSNECVLPGGAIGSVSPVCNANGTAYDAPGQCAFDHCQDGYVNIGSNVCQSIICDAGSKSTSPVACEYGDAAGVIGQKFFSCNANGTAYDIDGRCEFAGCLTGYFQEGNSCIAVICNPGDKDSLYSACELDQAGAIGKIANVCNANGTAFDAAGICEFDKCDNRHDQDGIACNPLICVPGEAGEKLSCELDLIGASGEAGQICNSKGTDYDLGNCEFIGCKEGFIDIQGECHDIVCDSGVANGEFISCELEAGFIGKKAVLCNPNGTAFNDYGSCEFDKCAEGFINIGNNECKATLCEPGSVEVGSAEACELGKDGAIGSIDRICNENGTAFIPGSCEFMGCEEGYSLYQTLLVGNVCMKSCDGIVNGEFDEPTFAFKSESPEFGAVCERVQQDRTCNNGEWTERTNMEFTASSCEEKACLPGSGKDLECELDYVTVAEIAKEHWTCNDSGQYDVGACIVIGCGSGYEFVGGECNELPILEDIVDTFKQKAQSEAKKLDVVWIIDNSGSMRDNQMHVKTNINAFADTVLKNEGMNIKMGITTTDVRKRAEINRYQHQLGNGYMYGGNGYLNAGGEYGGFIGDVVSIDSDMEEKAKDAQIKIFKQQINGMGIKGSGNEQGLKAMALSLNPVANPDIVNNFYRDDALLMYIIVSDENEGSNIPVPQYVELLKSKKGAAKIYSIVHKRGTNAMKRVCRTFKFFGKTHRYCYNIRVLSGQVGDRYEEASELTNGKAYEIREKFSDHLSDIGETAMTLLSSFPLSRDPQDAALLNVLVNGENAVEAGFEWEYDRENNAIKFIGEILPEDGSDIEVRYNIVK